MRTGASFDVLVIGSGASGLAAAVSAERAGARVGLATKTTLQACNSAKAQGGIQAAFGDDDSPEIHAEDVMRSSHDTADPELVRRADLEAPSAIHWLEEAGVEFTRSNGGYRLARCGGATRHRLLQVGDRTGHAITKALRDTFEVGSGVELPHHELTELRPGDHGWTASFKRKDGAVELEANTVVLAAGGRCFQEAEVARGALHEPSERDRRSDANRARRRSARRVTSTHSSTTRTAAPGRTRCRATRSPRRPARTARFS